MSWRDKFRIDKYPEWCDWLKEKVKTRNFDVGIHGYSHYQFAYPFQSEFKNLNRKEALGKIKSSEQLLEKTKIPFTRLFRPPGWFISNESIEVIKRRKYILAASGDMITPPSPKSICRITGFNGNLIYPHLIKNIINLTANCDLKRTRIERIGKIIKHSGLVLIHGHIMNAYHGRLIHNGIDEEAYQKLRKTFQFLKKHYGKKILYLGAKDIYDLLSPRFKKFDSSF